MLTLLGLVVVTWIGMPGAAQGANQRVLAVAPASIMPMISNSRIAGQVLTSGSDPVSGVTVAASGGIHTLTDEFGYYTLTVSYDGDASVTVTPSLTGYIFSPASYVVSVPPEAANRDFVATLAGLVSGKVVSWGSGSGLSGVTLAAGGYTTTTDAGGNYRLLVDPGSYLLVPSRIGYIFSPTSTLVSAPPGARNKNFSGTLPSRVTGHVDLWMDGVSQPHEGATALLMDGDDSVASTLTDDVGDFAFDGLYPGEYLLMAVRIGYRFGPTSTLVAVPPDSHGHNFSSTHWSQTHVPFVVKRGW